MTEQADIVVVGAGPAGLSAAIATAEAGVKVVLIDGYGQPGGQYFKQLPGAFTAAATTGHQRHAERFFRQIERPEITLLTETLVWGIYEDNLLTLYGPQAPDRLQARMVILATGAYDRPVAFPGWTLPGVMTAGAAQTMLKFQRIVPGQRVLLAGSGPLQLAVAAGLAWSGVEVVAVLEAAQLFPAGLKRAAAMWDQWARLAEGFNYASTLWQAGVPYRLGWGIVSAHGSVTAGVKEAVIAKLDADWRPIPGTEQTVECDTICLGYGFVPSTELSRLAGVEHVYHPQLGGWVPVRDEFGQTTVPNLYVVGDGAGIGGASLAMIEGRLAGLAAARRCQEDTASVEHLSGRDRVALARERRFQRMYGQLFTPGPGLNELADKDTILCRCEAVSLAQVEDAVAMGADSASAVKSLTRTGMGECQGRICASLVAAQIARLTGRQPEQIGTYTVRPPIHPLPLEVLAAGSMN